METIVKEALPMGYMHHLTLLEARATKIRDAGMYPELGGLNKWCHIWPYASFAERDRVRAEARQANAWPPQRAWRQSMVKQENKVLIPAAFSPMH